jgi:hypothetical protein
MPRGGKRPGAGAPAKDPLTADELALVLQIRAKGKRTHGSSWEVCAQVVSAGRVKGAVDPRTIADRSVSARWVREQVTNAGGIKLQEQSNMPTEGPLRGESYGTDYTGTRMGYDSPPGGSS